MYKDYALISSNKINISSTAHIHACLLLFISYTSLRYYLISEIFLSLTLHESVEGVDQRSLCLSSLRGYTRWPDDWQNRPRGLLPGHRMGRVVLARWGVSTVVGPLVRGHRVEGGTVYSGVGRVGVGIGGIIRRGIWVGV